MIHIKWILLVWKDHPPRRSIMTTTARERFTVRTARPTRLPGRGCLEWEPRRGQPRRSPEQQRRRTSGLLVYVVTHPVFPLTAGLDSHRDRCSGQRSGRRYLGSGGDGGSQPDRRLRRAWLDIGPTLPRGLHSSGLRAG